MCAIAGGSRGLLSTTESVVAFFDRESAGVKEREYTNKNGRVAFIVVCFLLGGYCWSIGFVTEAL